MQRGGRPPQARPPDHEHAEALLSQCSPLAGRQDLRQASPADEFLPGRPPIVWAHPIRDGVGPEKIPLGYVKLTSRLPTQNRVPHGYLSLKNVVYATRGVTTVVSATDGFTNLPLDYLTCHMTPSSTTSPLPDPFTYHSPTNSFFMYIIRSKVVQINFSKVVTRTRRSVRTHHRRGRDHGNGACACCPAPGSGCPATSCLLFPLPGRLATAERFVLSRAALFTGQ